MKGRKDSRVLMFIDQPNQRLSIILSSLLRLSMDGVLTRQYRISELVI